MHVKDREKKQTINAWIYHIPTKIFDERGRGSQHTDLPPWIRWGVIFCIPPMNYIDFIYRLGLVVSGHRLKFSGFYRCLFVCFVFVCFCFLVGSGCLFFVFIYFLFTSKSYSTRSFSTFHKEENGPKVINSTQKWSIFLLRILTRGHFFIEKYPVNILRGLFSSLHRHPRSTVGFKPST
jgi:hypothetical protein